MWEERCVGGRRDNIHPPLQARGHSPVQGLQTVCACLSNHLLFSTAPDAGRSREAGPESPFVSHTSSQALWGETRSSSASHCSLPPQSGQRRLAVAEGAMPSHRDEKRYPAPRGCLVEKFKSQVQPMFWILKSFQNRRQESDANTHLL